jgi:hypothetical protein
VHALRELFGLEPSGHGAGHAREVAEVTSLEARRNRQQRRR